jgi:hypothetical protein
MNYLKLFCSTSDGGRQFEDIYSDIKTKNLTGKMFMGFRGHFCVGPLGTGLLLSLSISISQNLGFS